MKPAARISFLARYDRPPEEAKRKAFLRVFYAWIELLPSSYAFHVSHVIAQQALDLAEQYGREDEADSETSSEDEAEPRFDQAA